MVLCVACSFLDVLNQFKMLTFRGHVGVGKSQKFAESELANKAREGALQGF